MYIVWEIVIGIFRSDLEIKAKILETKVKTWSGRIFKRISVDYLIESNSCFQLRH